MNSKVVERRFEVDTNGFKLQMATIKPWRIVQEIISNSFDEDTVKNITLDFEQIGNKKIKVTITDDGVGFEDINDVYTMYKYSKKRGKVDKRGRFNEGEKRFFVLAETGFVKTKNQMVEFEYDTRITSEIDHPTGTIVQGIFNWTGTDLKETLPKLHKLIVPEGKTLTINNNQVKKKQLLRTISIALPTLIEDNDTKLLRRVTKTTQVNLYQVNSAEKPYLYELGIPVHKLLHSIEWHIDVLQKIPLPSGRDMVSESYLKDLYAGILNNATDLIDKDNAGSKWVMVSMSESTPEAATHVLKNALGTDKVFIESTTDGRANDIVKEMGGRTLPKGFLDRDTRSHLMEMEVVKSATDEFSPTEFENLKPVEITSGMEFVMELTKVVAREVINKNIRCTVVDTDSEVKADYSQEFGLRWNSRVFDKEFFNTVSPEMVCIIIHELSHDKEGDDCIKSSHYSSGFVSEIQRIGGIVGYRGIQYFIDKCKKEIRN